MIYQFIVSCALDTDALMAGDDSRQYGVTVEASNRVEARLLAESMVGALGYEPTAVEVV